VFAAVGSAEGDATGRCETRPAWKRRTGNRGLQDMTFAKRLLLGTAAGLAFVSGAQAADLPGAEPVEYVKVCNTYGEGFFYIPGSDTCLQISGFARLETYAFDSRGTHDNVAFQAQTNLDFDARTETEYGTLRSFVRLEFSRNSGGPGSTPNTNSKLIEHAFVQFAGLTAGLTTSFFDFYANSNLFGAVAGSDRENLLLAYTATFGTGFSATIAIEDQTGRRWMGGDFDGGFYAEQTIPDVVANLRIEQGWGAAQLSGALHENSNALGNDKWGYAIQAGVKFNLDSLAEGDTLFLQAAYAKGALGYLQAGQGQNGFGYTSAFSTSEADDFTIGGARSDGYVLAGEFLHYWTPSLRSTFAASYADIDATAGGGFLDVSFKEYIGVASLVWSPVKKLDIGVEMAYSRLEFDNDVIPLQSGGFKDKTDAVSGILRVKRAF
jgi:hypothetical protein